MAGNLKEIQMEEKGISPSPALLSTKYLVVPSARALQCQQSTNTAVTHVITSHLSVHQVLNRKRVKIPTATALLLLLLLLLLLDKMMVSRRDGIICRTWMRSEKPS